MLNYLHNKPYTHQAALIILDILNTLLYLHHPRLKFPFYLYQNSELSLRKLYQFKRDLSIFAHDDIPEIIKFIHGPIVIF